MHEQAIVAFFGFNEMPLVSISDGQRAPILVPMWSPPSTMGCRLTCTRRHSIRGRPSSGAFHRKRAILVETTRLWASRTQVEHDGHAHIRQVISIVRINPLTNRRWYFQYAIEVGLKLV